MPFFNRHHSKSYDLSELYKRLERAEHRQLVVLRRLKRYRDSSTTTTSAPCRPLSTCLPLSAAASGDTVVDVQHFKSISDGGILDPDDKVVAVLEDKEQVLATFKEGGSRFRPSNIPNNVISSQMVSSNSTTSVSISTPSSSSASIPPRRRRAVVAQSNGVVGGGTGQPVCTSSDLKNTVSVSSAAVREQTIKTSSSDTPATADGHVYCTTVIQIKNEANSVAVHDLSVLPPPGSLVVRRGSDPSLSRNDKPEQVKYGVSSGEAPAKAGFSAGRGSGGQTPTNGVVQEMVEDDLWAKRPTSSGRGGDNRFSRSSLRKSRLNEKWLEIAAETSSEYLTKYGNAPVLPSSGLATSPFTSRSAMGVKRQHEFSVSPCDLWRPVGLDFEPSFDDSGKLCAARVCRVLVNGRFGLDNQVIAGDELTELNGRRVSSFDRFDSVIAFLNHLSNAEPLSVTVLRYATDGDAREAGTTVEQQGASVGVVSSKGSEACLSALQKGNTRKLGKQITVKLMKSEDGLGFTLTSRDFASSEGVESPVYIKNILPRGSAVKDGRLRAGDRLLKVDGQPVEGLTQPEVVKLLRSIEKGRYVELLVSRQESSPSPSTMPRHLEVNGNDTKYEQPMRVLTFDIPLNDSGSAGLGISVKGRVTSSTRKTFQGSSPTDLGIFIKSILHGGAAFKDGRLKVDDQLIGVNDCGLEGMSNQDALNQLRYTMKSLDPYAESIKLTIVRRVMECGEYEEEMNGVHWSNRSMGSPDGADSLMLGGGSFIDAARPVLPASTDSVDPALRNRDFSVDTTFVQTSSSLKVGRGEVLVERRESSVEEQSIMLDDDSEDRRNSRPEAQTDAFDREAPTRQSMSEKRRTAVRTGDVNDSHLFQKIKHIRQYSAPSVWNKHSTAASKAGEGYAVTRSQAAGADGAQHPSGLSRRMSISLESFVDTIGPVASASDGVLIHEQVVARSLNTKQAKGTSALHKSPVWCRTKGHRATFVAGSGPNKSGEQDAATAVVGQPRGGFLKYGEKGADVYVGPGQSTSDYLSDNFAPAMITSDQRNKGRRKSSSNSLASLKNLLRFGSGGKANKPVRLAASAQKYTEHPFERFPGVIEKKIHDQEIDALCANSMNAGVIYGNRDRGRSFGSFHSPILHGAHYDQCYRPTWNKFMNSNGEMGAYANWKSDSKKDGEFRAKLKKQHRSSGKETGRVIGRRPSSELVPERNGRAAEMVHGLFVEDGSRSGDGKGSAARPTIYPPPPDYDYYLRSKTFEKFKKRNRPFSDYADICASGSARAEKLVSVPRVPPTPPAVTSHGSTQQSNGPGIGSYVTRL